MIAFRIIGIVAGFLYAVALTTFITMLRNPVATGALSLVAIGVYSIY